MTDLKNKNVLRVVSLLMAVLLGGFVLGGCGGGTTTTTSAVTESTTSVTKATETTQPSGETIELSLASLYPPGSAPAASLDRWSEKIAADSGGRITIRHYAAGTLLPAPDMRTGVEAGTADLGSSFIYKPEPGFEPSMVLSSLILGLNYDDSLAIFDDIWNEFPELWAGQWDKFKLIWITVIDPNLLVTTDKAVRTVDDIAGLQIRVPTKTAAEMIKNLGATPVDMSSGDWVVSLDKGTTDGGATSVGSVLDYQIGEKLKYVTKYSTGPGVAFLIMNKQKYESLPADLQKVIDDNMEFGKQDMIKTKKDAEVEGYEYMKTSGIEVITLDPAEYLKWDAAVQPVFDKIAADLDAAGYPGTALVKFALERAKFYQSQ